MSEPRPEDGPGGVQWASPPVLLSLLALLVAATYALRSAPPATPPAPSLAIDAAAPVDPPVQETILYAVDEAGLAHPIAVDLPAPAERSARLQAIVDALRARMVEEGTWPAELPAPLVHAFTLERADVAVLDAPTGEVRLDVARERAILASLERTLLEHGVERIAYLRGGVPTPAWLGHLSTPSGLD